MGTKSARYLALLRGINVGGKNVIAKDELKQCFEDLGCTSVRTYIQSGNILFRSTVTNVKALTQSVEARLSERFQYEAQAVVLPHRKYTAAVAAAPDDWGADANRKHNALFTLAKTTPRKAVAQLAPPRTDLETVTIGPGVIFWSISKQHQGKTTFMKLAKDPVYQQVTIRNHNTVARLLQLFDEL